MSVLTANGFNFYLDVRLFGVDYVVSKLMGNGKYLAYCVLVSIYMHPQNIFKPYM